jgi:uncharacterized protein (DUF2249 family)
MTREILVDARWLEPPEPMERILAALALLRADEQVRFLIHREPLPLYSLLNNAGHVYQVEPMPDGSFALLIRPLSKSGQ